MTKNRPFLIAVLVLPLALWLVTAAAIPTAWCQDEPKTQPVQATKPYHGNVKTKKFHRHGCRYYSCRNCLANFKTREKAIKAGYYPCKVCKP